MNAPNSPTKSKLFTVRSISSRVSSSWMQLAPVLLLAMFPLFGRYNVSISSFWFYDFLSMNNGIIWFLLLMVLAILPAALSKDDLPLTTLLVIVCLFSIAEVWVNYPMIRRDVFFHGSAVRTISDEGHIEATWLSYPQAQPGFFLLWSVVSIVTGLGTFESNLLLLLPLGVGLLALLLARGFHALHIRTPNAAALLAFLLMNFNHNEDMFVHFNTRLLSSIYVLLFVLLFLRVRHVRGSNIMLVVTNTALVISHILNALVPITFLGIYWMIERKRTQEDISLFISCATVYIIWNLYQAYSFALGLYYSASAVLDYAAGLLPSESTTEPIFGPVIADYYKALVVSLAAISLFAAFKLRKSSAVRCLVFYLLSVLIVFGGTFFTLTSISVDRGLILGSFAFAGLPILLFSSVNGKDLRKRMHTILIIILILMIIPHFIFIHQEVYAKSLDTASVSETSTFLFNNRDGQSIVTTGDFPLYYTFYDPFYKGYELPNGILDVTAANSLTDLSLFFMAQNRGLKVVYFGQVLGWSLAFGHAKSFSDGMMAWDTNVHGPLNQHSNRVYSTSYETIYE